MDGDARRKEIREIQAKYKWFYGLIVGAVGLGLGVWIASLFFRADSVSYWMNVVTELIGIGGTVLIVDRLYAYRERQRNSELLKGDLLRSARSIVNNTAIRAIEQIKDRGWHTGENALLVGANLRNANLQKAPLIRVNLSKADLLMADLQHANLYEADLQEANLEWANLSGASLSYANMLGASLHEANLAGAHLYDTNLLGADLVRANIDEATFSNVTLPDGTTTYNIAEVKKFSSMMHPQFPEALESVNRIRHRLGLDILLYYG